MMDNPLFLNGDALVISGAGTNDETFTGEFGGRFLTYNVSKAGRDCKRGKHGQPYLFEVAPCYAANRNVEVDPDKVARFMTLPKVLATPLIMVIENGAAWLIEGHHRLRALYRLGAEEFLGYVIEEDKRERYLVLFNGKPELPAALRDVAAIVGKGGDA